MNDDVSIQPAFIIPDQQQPSLKEERVLIVHHLLAATIIANTVTAIVYAHQGMHKHVALQPSMTMVTARNYKPYQP